MPNRFLCILLGALVVSVSPSRAVSADTSSPPATSPPVTFPLIASTLSPMMREQLEAHQVWSEVLTPNASAKDGVVVRAFGLIHQPPEKVASVLLDVAKYHEYMPRTNRSDVLSQDPVGVMAHIEIDLPWPVEDAEVVARFDREPTPPPSIRVSCKVVRTNLREFGVLATIEPWNGKGNKSLVVYQTLVGIDTGLRDNVVIRGVQRYAEKVVHRLRMRLTPAS